MENKTNVTEEKKPLTITELMNRHLPALLKEGKYDNVTISEVDMSHATPDEKSDKQPYVRFVFKLEDGRTISENRFAQSLSIMISHLREQLNKQYEEVDVSNLLGVGNYKFSIWLTRPLVMTKAGTWTRATNINFLEPLNKPDEKTNKDDESAKKSKEIINDEFSI